MSEQHGWDNFDFPVSPSGWYDKGPYLSKLLIFPYNLFNTFQRVLELLNSTPQTNQKSGGVAPPWARGDCWFYCNSSLMRVSWSAVARLRDNIRLPQRSPFLKRACWAASSCTIKAKASLSGTRSRGLYKITHKCHIMRLCVRGEPWLWVCDYTDPY